MRRNHIPPYDQLEPRNGVLVIDGFGLALKVDRGHLVAEDGVGRIRRSRRFSKAGHGLDRVVSRALGTDTGLGIARDLLGRKIEGQVAVARQLGNAENVEAAASRLDDVNTLDDSHVPVGLSIGENPAYLKLSLASDNQTSIAQLASRGPTATGVRGQGVPLEVLNG
jgi:hypothetical protein